MKIKIVLSGILFLFLNLILISALDCPRGLVNDVYPGVCGLYTDSNDNAICDYSEIPAQKISISTSQVQEQKGKNYFFIQISLVLIVLYLISHFLSRKNIISMVFHKRLWNFLLLITFLGTGISGVLLVLRLEFGIDIGLFNWLFWHVETGIAMTLISIFHIIWHWNYFKSYFRVKFDNKKSIP
ncbi:MAG: DUF4405 domain-containing protein [Candidatus Nanoarchaeia archaeon]|nr:DUF4405 domain-containing protein [Candidatus Nanoarchaeia archaeon]